MNTLAYYLKNVDAFSSPPATMEELSGALAQNRTMWYMSFGGYYNPQEDVWVQENLRRVDGGDWMRSDLDYVPSDEFSFTQSEPLLQIYTRQGKIPSEIRYDNELGDRARATPFIPVKPGDSLEAQLAPGGGGTRVLEIEYTSKDPARFEVVVNGAPLANVRDDNAKTKPALRQWLLPADLKTVSVVVLNTETPSALQIRAVRLVRE